MKASSGRVARVPTQPSPQQQRLINWRQRHQHQQHRKYIPVASSNAAVPRLSLAPRTVAAASAAAKSARRAGRRRHTHPARRTLSARSAAPQQAARPSAGAAPAPPQNGSSGSADVAAAPAGARRVWNPSTITPREAYIKHDRSWTPPPPAPVAPPGDAPCPAPSAPAGPPPAPLVAQPPRAVERPTPEPDVVSFSVQTWNGHAGAVRSLCGVSGGRFVVSGSQDGTVRVWDATTGGCVRLLAGHAGVVNGVGSFRGVVASCSADGTVRVWDIHRGRCAHVLAGHGGAVSSVAFSPGGTHLVSASRDCTVRVWDPHSGACKHVLRGHTAAVTGMVLGSFVPSPALYLAARAKAGADDAPRHRSPRGVSHALATCSSDRSVRLWNYRTGGCLAELRGHDGAVFCVALVPRQLPAAAARDAATSDAGGANGTNAASAGANANANGAATGQQQARTENRRRWRYHPSEFVVTGGEDGARVWSVPTLTCVHCVSKHGGPVHSLRIFRSRGPAKEANAWSTVLATAGRDGKVFIHSLTNGCAASPRPLEGHNSWVLGIRASKCGTLLASCGFDKSVRVWDVATGKCLQALGGHDACVFGVRFLDDGGSGGGESDGGAVGGQDFVLVSISQDATLRCWKLRREKRRIPEKESGWQSRAAPRRLALHQLLRRGKEKNADDDGVD